MTNANATQLNFKGQSLELESVPCDFCGGTDFAPFWGKMRHGLNLETVFCRRCSLCQTNPRPTAEANRQFHSQMYMQFHANTSESEGDYVTRSARIAAPRVTQLARVIGADRPLSVFEVGCGVAQFQKLAREQTAWKLSGIEPGREQYELNRKLGFEVENRFLDDLPKGTGPFDVVVCFHVLEHFLSPADFVRRVNRLLPIGGLLYVEVPNLAWPGTPFTDFLQLPHFYNFTAATLRNYLTAIGGFRPVYSSEGRSNLGMMARKIGEPREGTPGEGEFEAFDLERFRQKMKVLERVFKLARLVPNLPMLNKVRATLFDV
jgi:2-polyprenyl-3-methyl-5-hydroxy-6-metoxy-1,4-benzoquinol methylase